IKRSVRDHYTIPESRLQTLFNGVDISRFDPSIDTQAADHLRVRLGLSQDQIIALIIAQDFERKGLREAIEALARIHDPRLTLLVVGKQDPARYRAQAESLGVPKHVIFAGPTPDPRPYYQLADFFV